MDLYVWVLKNIHKYDDGEEYFYADVFASESEAVEKMRWEYEDAMSDTFSQIGKDDLSQYIDGGSAEIRSGDNVFTWEIQQQLVKH